MCVDTAFKGYMRTHVSARGYNVSNSSHTAPRLPSHLRRQRMATCYFGWTVGENCGDWLAAPKKCSAKPFTGKVAYHFPHSQPMKIRELPTEFCPVDVLVCIET